MSTYWYFECLDHDPPIVSEDEFTQHTDDDYFKQAVAFAESRPVSDDDLSWGQSANWSREDSMAYFGTHALRFLRRHPRCNLGLLNEYGVRRDLSGSVTT